MWVLQIIVAICLMFQMERAIFDTNAFFRLSRRLKKVDRDSFLETRNTRRKKLFILIPVFSEQKIIEKTISHFLRIDQTVFDIQIVVITTIRESLIPGVINTEQLINQSLVSGILSPFKNRILVIQDLDLYGNMATQLNYALKVLNRDGVHSDDLYMLYNADSVVSGKTFSALSSLFVKYSHINNYAFQQPCAYVRDMKVSSPNFLNALSLYQTWYCLAHESRLIQKYERMIQKKGKSRRLGVTVGHGSGMPIRVHFANGGYPADLMTEDLTFAFVLSANNVPIFLLPALEIADVPGKLSSFIKQKSVWFWNYIGYLSCYQRIKRGRKGSFGLFVLLMRGIGGGAYWFFSALFILIPLLLSSFLNSFAIAGVIFATLLFTLLPYYILLRKLPSILRKQGFDGFAENVRGVSFAQVFFPLCLIIVTDSIGPWIATMRSFHYFLTGKLPRKYKTES